MMHDIWQPVKLDLEKSSISIGTVLIFDNEIHVPCFSKSKYTQQERMSLSKQHVSLF